jgi:hypothetical protein
VTSFVVTVTDIRLPSQEFLPYLNILFFYRYNRGTLLVVQLVKALRYKPEGRGFDSRWCHWNSSLT